MSDVDPTPETPVTIGDRMGWFRGDIDAKMLLLLQKLNDLITQTTTLNTAITTLNTTITTKTEMLDDTCRELLISPAGHTNAALLQYIDSVLGGYPYGSTELSSIKSFLYAIMGAVQRVGITPNLGTTPPSRSTSTISIDGFRYIQWGNIPGLTVSTDKTMLTPTDSWSGYQIYIQTNAPHAILFDKTDPQFDNNALGANTWITLGGDHSFIFAVTSNYDAIGYIRTPPSPYDCDGIEGYTLVWQKDTRSWAEAIRQGDYFRLYMDPIDYTSDPITEIVVVARAIQPEPWGDYAGFAYKVDTDPWKFQVMTDFNALPKTYTYTLTPYAQTLEFHLHCTYDIAPIMAVCVFVKH